METNAPAPERILLLYLKTGGGHYSGCKALADYYNSHHPHVQTHMVDGIPSQNHFQRQLVESGYSVLINSIPFGWRLVFQITRLIPSMQLQSWLMTYYSANYLASYIRKNKITRVINTHFLLVRPLEEALTRIKRRELPVLTVVMDPFTPHPFWFYRLTSPVAVFSKRVFDNARWNMTLMARSPVRQLARKLETAPIKVFPPLLAQEFSTPMELEAIKSYVTTELKFDPDKAIILMVGGGEGLPKGAKYLKAVTQRIPGVQVIFVAAKNKKLKSQAEQLKAQMNLENLRVFGFTNHMYQLMNCASIIVTKGGPATVFECLSLSKPMILVDYLPGQEKGNKEYVTKNDLGWFIRSPRIMARQLEHILADPSVLAQLKKNIARQSIQNGTSALAEYALGVASLQKPTKKRENL